MRVNTISPYETSAEAFFEKLAAWHTDLVLDVRLHNTNQLAGFSKRDDLAYFVKAIQHADYVYDASLAPTEEILSPYLKGNISWEEFFSDYRAEIEERDGVTEFLSRYGEYESVALVGTATHKRRSHVEVLKAMVDESLSAPGDSATSS